MEQATLFEQPTEQEQKFKEYHAKNPQIYAHLVKLTKQAVDRGRRKIGIQMLIEVVRWNTMIQTTDTDFKINNDYGCRYARLIMDEHPEFGKIFETRTIKR